MIEIESNNTDPAPAIPYQLHKGQNAIHMIQKPATTFFSQQIQHLKLQLQRLGNGGAVGREIFSCKSIRVNRFHSIVTGGLEWLLAGKIIFDWLDFYNMFFLSPLRQRNSSEKKLDTRRMCCCREAFKKIPSETPGSR